MCNLAWHPVWRAAGKDARVRPGTVYAVFRALEGEGDKAARLTPAIVAAGLGWRIATVERVMASLASHGVTCDGMVTAEWRSEVSAPPGLSMKPSAIRMRAKRLRDRGGTAEPIPAPASPGVTGDAEAPSLSLFPDLQEEKQIKPRAGAASPGDGFAELRALWPLSNRMAEAESEYHRALRKVSHAELMGLAERYLAEKPPDRYCMFLVNWLRTPPWRDPVLPLAATPRVVAQDPSPRVEFWKPRLDELKATGIWKAEWGPAWGEPGCRVPPESGVAYSIARWFADHPPQITEQPERARG